MILKTLEGILTSHLEMGPTGQEACGAAVPAFAVHSHLSDKMSITSTIIIVAVVSALQS